MRYLILPLIAAMALVSCRNPEPSVPNTDPGSQEPSGAAMKPDAKTKQQPESQPAMTYNKLNEQEAYVIQQKGTEGEGVGEYTDTSDDGTYICRQCNAELYRSKDKFHSNCGWPSFDLEIDGAVNRHDDLSAGMTRTEIVCSNCKGHLGHVFHGERLTEKNTRHCVNSISMRFIKAGEKLPAKIVLPKK